MIKNLKKLNIPILDKEIKKCDSLLDLIDSEYAIEHYGRYIIIPEYKKKYSRVYLSHKLENEYLNKKNKKSIKITDLHLFEQYQNREPLLLSFINYIPNPCDKNFIKVIRGLKIFLDFLNTTTLKINCLIDIKKNFQRETYSYCQIKQYKQAKFDNLRYFFGFLEMNFKDFNAIDIPNKSQYINESKPALASSIIYQLDYYAREDIEKTIQNVELYKSWIEEFKLEDLFSLENLACTYYLDVAKWGRAGVSGFNILNKVAKSLHNIQLNSWKNIKNGKFYYNSKNEELEHKRLLALSQKGKNIEIRNLKMLMYWHYTIFPNFPFDDKPNNKLKDVFPRRTRFLERRTIKADTTVSEINNMMFPSSTVIYSFFLFLLIREGLNSNTLFNIKINKDNGEIKLGNENNIALVIFDLLKEKSNIKYNLVIKKDSLQYKYIKFLLTWSRDIYLNSKSTCLFQFITTRYKISDYNIYNLVTGHTIPDTFLKRYEIKDNDNNRIYRIEHSRIRSYKNFANYLHGLTLFERQMELGHSNLDTQKFYENNIEWTYIKHYKIAQRQNEIIDIIRNDNQESELSKLFQGPISDCKNPLKPTYINSKELKEDEFCSEWRKCLTQCDKSQVIPNIHGPVIYAWIKFMEEEKDKFIRYIDWEKEYAFDYYSAMNTFECFNDIEKEYSKKFAFKHKYYVATRFTLGIKKRVVNE